MKNNQDGTAFPAATVDQVSVHTVSQVKETSQNLIQDTSISRDDFKHGLLQESNYDYQTSKCGLPQPSNLGSNMDADQTVKERKSVMVADPIKAIINDVIVLSDSDEDVNITVTSSAARKGVENPDISIWYCSGIRGSETKGPFPMSVLKHWSELDSTFSPLDFKVWKTDESEREAMLLRDALGLFFPPKGK